jgi:hypothetical protein
LFQILPPLVQMSGGVRLSDVRLTGIVSDIAPAGSDEWRCAPV